jgi:hypothetical protein
MRWATDWERVTAIYSARTMPRDFGSERVMEKLKARTMPRGFGLERARVRYSATTTRSGLQTDLYLAIVTLMEIGSVKSTAISRG